MSIERHPSSDYSLDKLIDLCEKAVAEERLLAEVDSAKVSFNGVRYCIQVARHFERLHHVMPDFGTPAPALTDSTLNLLFIRDPSLFFARNPELDDYCSVTTKGSLPVWYAHTDLMESYSVKNESYEGPHFVGVFDTESLHDSVLMANRVLPGLYPFAMPTKNVEVDKPPSQRRFC